MSYSSWHAGLKKKGACSRNRSCLLWTPHHARQGRALPSCTAGSARGGIWSWHARKAREAASGPPICPTGRAHSIAQRSTAERSTHRMSRPPPAVRVWSMSHSSEPRSFPSSPFPRISSWRRVLGPSASSAAAASRRNAAPRRSTPSTPSGFRYCGAEWGEEEGEGKRRHRQGARHPCCHHPACACLPPVPLSSAPSAAQPAQAAVGSGGKACCARIGQQHKSIERRWHVEEMERTSRPWASARRTSGGRDSTESTAAGPAPPPAPPASPAAEGPAWPAEPWPPPPPAE